MEVDPKLGTIVGNCGTFVSTFSTEVCGIEMLSRPSVNLYTLLFPPATCSLDDCDIFKYEYATKMKYDVQLKVNIPHIRD